MRVEIYDSIDSMREAQMRDEMKMTPEQRLELVFQLIDLAIAISPDHKLKSSDRDNLPWIELHFKDDIG